MKTTGMVDYGSLGVGAPPGGGVAPEVELSLLQGGIDKSERPGCYESRTGNRRVHLEGKRDQSKTDVN